VAKNGVAGTSIDARHSSSHHLKRPPAVRAAKHFDRSELGMVPALAKFRMINVYMHA
jgi:hypothetical protein